MLQLLTVVMIVAAFWSFLAAPDNPAWFTCLLFGLLFWQLHREMHGRGMR